MNRPTLAQEVANATRRHYRGSSVMKFILFSEDTNGALSIIDVHMLAGTEPPRHVHLREDEVFIIKKGELTFFIGENLVKGRPGDVIFAPRGVAHNFRIDTPSAKVLTIITPGDFARFFWKQSVPHSAGEPVLPLIPPSRSVIQSVMKFASEYNVRVA